MTNTKNRKFRDPLSRLNERVWHFKRVQKIARMEEVVHGGVSRDTARTLARLFVQVEFGLAAIER